MSSLAYHAGVSADQLARAVDESGLFGTGVTEAARAKRLGLGVAKTSRLSKVTFLWLGASDAAWTPGDQLFGEAAGWPPPPRLRARLRAERQFADFAAPRARPSARPPGASAREAKQPPPPPSAAAEQAKAERAAGYAASVARRVALVRPDCG